MKQITFSSDEEDFIHSLLDWWEDGIAEARVATIEDSAIGTAEELLELTEGYSVQQRRVNSIRDKLRGGTVAL